MLRTLLSFRIHPSWRSAPPCCAPAGRTRRRLLLALAVAVALLCLLPAAARPDAPAPHATPEVVAEALFLCDPLPPGGLGLNLSVAGAPDAGGRIGLASRVQVALGIGERLGLTADVGLDPAGGTIRSPAASLKALLRVPANGALGIAASLDLLAGASGHAAETALGLGIIAPLGRLALRAGASGSTRIDGWTPHLHAGGSAALAFGTRWRVLCEVVSELGDGPASWSAGPTVKVALDAETSVSAGALVDLRQPAGLPAFAVQLARAL